MRVRAGWILGLMTTGLAVALPAVAQRGEPAQTSGQTASQTPVLSQRSMSGAAPFTLESSSRIVLTDVTVTDSKGRPVHGLPELVFHILDDGKLQQISSFVEHHDEQSDAAASSMPVSTSNIYSNEFLLHPPAVLNVILLDTTNLRINDQMYLYYQMKKFVDQLPERVPFAVYSQSGLYTIEQQTFTADHALLLAAIRRAIPQLPNPDGQYASDFETLHQLVIHLNQLPGRKNVLWFSGGSNLGLLADASDLPAFENLQPVYDELEASRIALYPIDARGLTVGFSPGRADQQLQMEQSAEATGGHATFNSNGLAQAALNIAANDGSYYTLSYAPSDLKFDNKWHKVKVAVDLPDGYHLSYRHGYYDDGANTRTPGNNNRMVLKAGGEKDKVKGPDMTSRPIIFNVSVTAMVVGGDAARAGVATAPEPGVNKGRQPHSSGVPYTLSYSVPVSEFDRQQTVAGDPNERQVKLGAAVVAFNSFGRPVDQKVQQVTITVNEKKLEANPSAAIPFAMGVELPVGADSLYAMVWDMATRRTGSIELPVTVPKSTKGKR